MQLGRRSDVFQDLIDPHDLEHVLVHVVSDGLSPELVDLKHHHRALHLCLDRVLYRALSFRTVVRVFVLVEVFLLDTLGSDHQLHVEEAVHRSQESNEGLVIDESILIQLFEEPPYVHVDVESLGSRGEGSFGGLDGEKFAEEENARAKSRADRDMLHALILKKRMVEKPSVF